MSFVSPNSVPVEPLPHPNGVNEDAISEWHCRVPLSGLSLGVDDNLRYLDGVGFTDDDDQPIDPAIIPEKYKSADFQQALGKNVVAARVLLRDQAE